MSVLIEVERGVWWDRRCDPRIGVNGLPIHPRHVSERLRAYRMGWRQEELPARSRCIKPHSESGHDTAVWHRAGWHARECWDAMSTTIRAIVQSENHPSHRPGVPAFQL